MAKIGAMPSQAQISGLRGAIDFYEWRGLHVVRSWPRYKPTAQSAATKAAQIPFAYVNRQTDFLPPHVISTWYWLANQSNLTWRDWMNRAYLGATLAAPGKAPL